ncbi:MAG: DUF2059 domain-containing protein [Beijerinckiaceae bacterium]
MKNFSFVMTAAFAAALALAAPAFGQGKISASHLAAAKELVAKTQLAKTFDAFVPQLGVQMTNNVTRTRPELKKDLDAVLDQVVPEFDKEKAQLIDKTSRFFAEALTEDEIKKVVAFYNTPAGEKFLVQQPKVLDRMVVEIDNWNRDLAQRMLEKVRGEMKKRGHDM